MTFPQAMASLPPAELLLALGLSGLAVALGRRLPRRRPQAARDFGGDERASAMLDFILVFPLFTMVILVLAQLALLINARLVVSYSAYAACRSAVVWLEEGEQVARARAEKAAEVGCLAISPAGVTPWGGLVNALPVAPLYVHSISFDLDFLRRILRGGSKFTYSKLATSANVILPDGELGPHDPVTVEVTHEFYLSVPYGDRLFRSWDFGPFGLPFRTIRDSYTLTNEGRVQSR